MKSVIGGPVIRGRRQVTQRVEEGENKHVLSRVRPQEMAARAIQPPRASGARIKDLAAQLQQWLDEPEGDVIWEDLGDDHERSTFAGRGRLYRDRDRGRLGGVCAGLAQYYRMRLWKVRVIALVALFIIPTVMVIAYVLALSLIHI